jgi:fermentation-respiration switch protein FrsA (DUF1100 family)
MLGLLSTAAGLYVTVSLAIMLGQRRMIYCPTRFAAGLLDPAAAPLGLRRWTNETGQAIGWWRPSRLGPARARVLIVHGNAGSALDRVDYVDGLQGIEPVDVFILEYPGYGDRPGSPSQTALLQAAEEGFRLVSQHGPVFVLGESLGTGVASYLAGTFSESVAGVVLVCPYHDFTALAQSTMPLFPVRWMLWDRFPSAQWLARYPGPVGILLAENDTIVPARFGQKLYDSYAGRKRRWVVPGANHNDVFTRPAEWWRELWSFWHEPGEGGRNAAKNSIDGPR